MDDQGNTIRVSRVTPITKRYTKGFTFKDIDLDRFNIIGTKVIGAARITLFSSKDGLHCFGMVEGNVRAASVEEVAAFCQRNRVPLGDDAKLRVKEYLDNEAIVGGEQAAVVIARGREVKHGLDSVVQWHIEPPAFYGAGQEADDGSVDFRERSTFVHVEAEQHILSVTPPTRGEDGCDFRGNRIPATDGAWKRPLAGIGIRADQSQQEMYAESSGVIQMTPDNRIHIRKMLEVHDVDFKTGNIHYNGDIDVGGTIREGFEVETTGIVNVVQDIEKAKVTASKIIVAGATLGSEVTSPQGSVKLARAENTKVRADKGVELTEDAVNLTIHCGGKLSCPRKKLIGSKVVALGGVELGWLGGRDQDSTSITIDADKASLPCLDEHQAKLAEIHATLDKLKAALAPVLANQKQAMANLSPAQRDAVSKLLDKYNTLEFERSVTESARKAALRETVPQVVKEIHVHQGISDGVQVTIGELGWRPDGEMRGSYIIKVAADGNPRIICVEHEFKGPA